MAKSRVSLVNGAIAKNIHPSEQVQSKLPNADAGRRLEGAVALRLDDSCYQLLLLEMCLIE